MAYLVLVHVVHSTDKLLRQALYLLVFQFVLLARNAAVYALQTCVLKHNEILTEGQLLKMFNQLHNVLMWW